MKQNINLVTIFDIKEGTRTENAMFKVDLEVVPVKLAALLKRNFPYEIFSSEFLRSYSFEVSRVVNCQVSKFNKESNDTSRCQQYSCFHRCSTNYVFLKILQNSQENTCAGNTLWCKGRPNICNCIKNDSSAGVFLWITRNLKNNEHLRVEN